jgi:hypothetical protein
VNPSPKLGEGEIIEKRGFASLQLSRNNPLNPALPQEPSSSLSIDKESEK